MVFNYNGKQPTIYFNFEDKSVLMGNASIIVYNHKIEIIFHNGKVTTTSLDTLDWTTAFIAPYKLQFRHYTFTWLQTNAEILSVSVLNSGGSANLQTKSVSLTSTSA